ncbi:MAG: hypothetical protein IPP72_09725 [Chitinophagaceae bacterium]|nr:hypothetical protein [Chitinophagaceae bacterium]
MRKCYKKEGKVFFEFWEPIKSLNPASGVDANYNEDSTTVRIAFLREPMDGIKYQPDIKSVIVREGDSVVYWRIELPGIVNKIIVTAPDSLFIENIKD